MEGLTYGNKKHKNRVNSRSALQQTTTMKTILALDRHLAHRRMVRVSMEDTPQHPGHMSEKGCLTWVVDRESGNCVSKKWTSPRWAVGTLPVVLAIIMGQAVPGVL